MSSRDLRHGKNCPGLRGRRNWDSTERDSSCGLDLVDQFGTYFKNLFSGKRSGLLNKIDRSRIECRKSGFSSLFRDAHDDDGERTSLQLFPYKADAFQLRHDEITRDHVRLEPFHQIERFSTVARRPDHFDERTARQDLANDLPHVGRIVYDYNS